MSNKKYQEVEEHESVASNEQKNNETEAPLSKSAKKRAKKNQKKAAEATNVQTSLVNQNEKTTKTPEKSGDEKTTPEKIDKNETIMKHAEKKPEKKKSISQKTEKKKMEKIDEEKVDDQGGTSTVVEKEDEQPGKVEKRPVPRIQRFDANGKPIKTLAGKNSFYLGQITPHNVFQLKTLNEAVLPIKYNDKFYVEARTCGDFGRLAYFNDVVAGAVCCRIDDISDEKALYIMTLGTLPAYRQIGIGTKLIDYVHKLCDDYDEINSVYLHVQVNNQNAVHFYEKHGFYNDGIIEDYYGIEPRDAYLLMKRIS